MTNPIKVVITNYPEGQIEMCTVENNRKVPELGEREVPFGRELWIDGDDFMEVPVKKYFRLFPGNEVRFKGAYYITCNEVIKNERWIHSGAALHLRSGNPRRRRAGRPEGEGTIHFVEASTAVRIRIREYDYMMIEDEEGNSVFNEDSLRDTWVMQSRPSRRQSRKTDSSSSGRDIILQTGS